jgi:hypothetical protein
MCVYMHPRLCVYTHTCIGEQLLQITGAAAAGQEIIGRVDVRV